MTKPILFPVGVAFRQYISRVPSSSALQEDIDAPSPAPGLSLKKRRDSAHPAVPSLHSYLLFFFNVLFGYHLSGLPNALLETAIFSPVYSPEILVSRQSLFEALNP